MALNSLNSVAGYSVGEIPLDVIYGNGDIRTGNIVVTGSSNIGNIGNIKLFGGVSGQFISTDGNGNLSFTTVSTSELLNGTSNINVINSGNITFGVAGNSNVLTVTSSGANITGYLTVSGNASFNKVTSVFDGDGGNISNINASNILSGTIATGLLSGTYNISISGLAATANTVTNNSQPNITSVGTLTGLSVSGNATVGGLSATSGSLTGNINMNNNYITNLPTPLNANDAATKSYVDGLAEGLLVHPACQVATTTTLAAHSSGTITYNNGINGIDATLTTTGSFSTIDGIPVNKFADTVPVFAEIFPLTVKADNVPTLVIFG